MSFFTVDHESDSSLTLQPGSAVAMAYAPALFMWTAWAQATTFWTEAVFKAMTLAVPKSSHVDTETVASVTLSETVSDFSPAEPNFEAPVQLADSSTATTMPRDDHSAMVVDAPDVMSSDVTVVEAAQPSGLSEARHGGADDLKMISGVGPKIEGILHSLGIFHFDQVASWTEKEVAWVDEYLNFKGRIGRDDWVAQADALAVGGREEYVRRFGKEPR